MEYYSEKVVEARLKKEVKAQLGGLALKFVSPGNSGVPDRIIVLPFNIFAGFVELKSTGRGLDPLQIYWHKKLRRMGYDVRVIDTVPQVLEYVNYLKDKYGLQTT
jgi:hypothetical protein